MGSFDQLLVLQEHDTTVEQLQHRREALPERAQLVAHRQSLVALEQQLATAQQQRDDVARAQKRYEDEVATIEAKVSDVHGQLYGGKVTAPKELQALQDDETALKRHQGTVEDKVIEQMELAVPLDEELDRLAGARPQAARQAVAGQRAPPPPQGRVDAPPAP